MRGETRPTMSAEAFTALVRAYADRVHDDMRRLGATPAEAAEIVEASALDALDALLTSPTDAARVLGRWFAQARVLVGRLVDDINSRPADPDASAEAPEGLIRGTALDLAARAGLARLSPRDREALLLQDAYELPETATALALGLDLAEARALVTGARVRFAQGGEVRGPSDVPLLLRGLAILALPDTERDTILMRVERAAGAVLPADAEAAALLEEADRPGPSRAAVVAVLTGALVLGSLVGIVTAPATPESSASGKGGLPPDVEPFDVRKVDPAFATPTATPSPTSVAAPTASASATATSQSTPSSAPTSEPTRSVSSGPPAISLSPTSGPNCTSVRVSGRNFTAGLSVEVTYADPLGRRTRSRSNATVDVEGRFSVRFLACDDNRLPGPHRISATSAEEDAAATFTATS